jgi:acetylornithine/N-succinyldiaminopimelate aminotransferase
MTLSDRDRASLLGVYKRLSIEIERGEGVYLIDTEGKRYLDFFGGLAVNALGYGHAEVLAAISEQIASYVHVSNLFPQKPQIELAERLRALTGYDKVFLANSGAEIMEAAFKLARRWGSIRRRKRMLAFSGAFHGRSYTGLSLMDTRKYRDGFDPFLEHCEILPFNDVDALRAAVDTDVAAVTLEFIQGEGGIIPAGESFIETLFELRDEYGFLIIDDEIQAGMGRTGRFLACEHHAVQPDVILLAKSLGGGLPLSAMLLRADLVDVLGSGSHGSTFGGNPVACAAGCAVLDVLRDGAMRNAREAGNALIEGLRTLASRHSGLIRDIRGRGCMIGVEFNVDISKLMQACLGQGLLVNVTRERVLRLLPPYIIDDTHREIALRILDNVLNDKRTWQ